MHISVHVHFMNTFHEYFYLVPGKLLLCGDLGFGGCLSPPVPPSPGMGTPPPPLPPELQMNDY